MKKGMSKSEAREDLWLMIKRMNQCPDEVCGAAERAEGVVERKPDSRVIPGEAAKRLLALRRSARKSTKKTKDSVQEKKILSTQKKSD